MVDGTPVPDRLLFGPGFWIDTPLARRRGSIFHASHTSHAERTLDGKTDMVFDKAAGRPRREPAVQIDDKHVGRVDVLSVCPYSAGIFRQWSSFPVVWRENNTVGIPGRTDGRGPSQIARECHPWGEPGNTVRRR